MGLGAFWRSLALVTLIGCGAAPPRPTPTARTTSTCTSEPHGLGLERLTRREYDRTVRDLLDDDAHAASTFPADDDTLGFATGGAVSPMLAERLLHAAETLAERAARDRLETLAPCPDLEIERCAREFVVHVGRRAYRRTLTTDEIERLLAVFRVGAGDDGSLEGGVRLALTAMLVSPSFLYRAGRASRLSYFLWGSMPDDTLLDAAESGALETPDQIEAQARRMLADPRAREQLASFVTEWLELDGGELVKDEQTYPEWSPELGAVLTDSTQRFVESAVFEGPGTLEALLMAPFAFVDDRIAPLYGVAPPESSTLVRVALDPRERAGLLTQPAFLARHASTDRSSPVLRGRVIRERLLCQPMPSPPDDVMPLLALDAARPTTTRARFEGHLTDPSCVGCHTLMDPVGFAFEQYDGVGRYRTHEGDAPIDAHGELVLAGSRDASVNGGVALSQRLAASPEVSRCFAEQVWRFALRRLAAEDEACVIDEVAAAPTIPELLVRLTRSDAFTGTEPTR